jgi:hypothetical protein
MDDSRDVHGMHNGPPRRLRLVPVIGIQYDAAKLLNELSLPDDLAYHGASQPVAVSE